MRSSILSRLVLLILLGGQLSIATMPAQAGVLGTGDYLAQDGAAAGDRAERIRRVRDFLAEDRVRAQLESLGVDAAAADARVASLSDAELARLDARLDQLPAGQGVIGVVGVVFVVLLILELVGVTDIFKSF